jgi:hypothetical protein
MRFLANSVLDLQRPYQDVLDRHKYCIVAIPAPQSKYSAGSHNSQERPVYKLQSCNPIGSRASYAGSTSHILQAVQHRLTGQSEEADGGSWTNPAAEAVGWRRARPR